MRTLTTWEQTAIFDPSNPNQMIQEHDVGIPGGRASFYFNKVPTYSTLMGLGAEASAAVAPGASVSVVSPNGTQIAVNTSPALTPPPKGRGKLLLGIVLGAGVVAVGIFGYRKLRK